MLAQILEKTREADCDIAKIIASAYPFELSAPKIAFLESIVRLCIRDPVMTVLYEEDFKLDCAHDDFADSVLRHFMFAKVMKTEGFWKFNMAVLDKYTVLRDGCEKGLCKVVPNLKDDMVAAIKSKGFQVFLSETDDHDSVICALPEGVHAKAAPAWFHRLDREKKDFIFALYGCDLAFKERDEVYKEVRAVAEKRLDAAHRLIANLRAQKDAGKLTDEAYEKEYSDAYTLLGKCREKVDIAFAYFI